MLLKLWNSIRGNSSPAPATSGSASKRPHTGGEQRKLAKPTKPGRGMLGLGGGPHSALCKQLKKINVASVLEIGVGDGTRAAAALQTLQATASNSEIQYIAIDQFEMGGSDLTLKHFHQQIRALGVKPNLIPMPIEQGLTRLAHTIGTVDLVLMDEADLDAASTMLSRIAKSDTVLLVCDGQVWNSVQADQISGRKNKAA